MSGKEFTGSAQHGKNYMQYIDSNFSSDDNKYAQATYYTDILKNNQNQETAKNQGRSASYYNQQTKQEENPETASNYYLCPVCSSLAIRVSDSSLRDASCSNGHEWVFFEGKKRVKQIK